MKKVIVIERCRECPFASLEKDNKDYGSCDLTYSKISDSFEILDNCPLEDLKENKNENT